jgi:hypothetical protein
MQRAHDGPSQVSNDHDPSSLLAARWLLDEERQTLTSSGTLSFAEQLTKKCVLNLNM